MPVKGTKNKHTPAKATPSLQSIIAALIIFALGFGIFVFLHTTISAGSTPPVDYQVAQWMTTHRTPFVTGVMEIITNALSPIGFALMVIITSLVWMWRKKEFWRPSLLLGAMAAAFVIAAFVKASVGRIRPPIEYMIAPFELDFAFPSGHTIGIATFALVIGYLIYSRRKSVAVLMSWLTLTVAATVLVAISRMYLGYHWFSDTLAATSLAAIILAAVILIDALRPEPATKEAVSNTGR